MLYVLVYIQHDFVLPHGLGDDSNGMDLVHSHYDIQTPKQSFKGSLNASDEQRELLIVPDQHQNLCFV